MEPIANFHKFSEARMKKSCKVMWSDSHIKFKKLFIRYVLVIFDFKRNIVQFTQTLKHGTHCHNVSWQFSNKFCIREYYLSSKHLINFEFIYIDCCSLELLVELNNNFTQITCIMYIGIEASHCNAMHCLGLNSQLFFPAKLEKCKILKEGFIKTARFCE